MLPLNQFDPVVRVTAKFLSFLKVKANATTVSDSLQNHPDWPSLLCVTDLLTKWSIPNAVGSLSVAELDQLPIPFLALLKNDEAPFALVEKVTATEITFYQGVNSRANTISRQDFATQWQGVYLIAEANNNSKEPLYIQNRRKRIASLMVQLTAVIAIVGVTSALVIQGIIRMYKYNIIFGYVIECLVMLAGTLVTSLLVWYELDKNNPLIKKICSGLVKTDCNAILSTNKAKVFSWLSWAEVGFFFFTGGLMLLLLPSSPVTSPLLLVAWLNVIAFPYTIFSIYYQGVIVKQWCTLCLAVQVLLLSGAINVLYNKLLLIQTSFTFFSLVTSILFFALPTLLWFTIRPYLHRLEESKNIKREHLRLKFNPDIFYSTLGNQKVITHPLDSLGIELGNPNATNTIVEVCSTNCGPCSIAHPKLEELLEANNNLKVKIIFAVSVNLSEQMIKPVRHLLAIAEQGNPDLLNRALSDWHAPLDKNYERFAAKYPLNGELLLQDEKIAAMQKWCNAMGITATPTYFLNGHQLPALYNIEDMHYFLLEDEPALKQA